MESNNELLVGTWIHDPEDIESIRRFGNVKLHFTEDGQLIYTILGEEKDQKIFLTYRVENNVLITDQPSDPREERTNFRITEDGKLEQECLGGDTARYVRAQMTVKTNKTNKTIMYTIHNFAQFVGFYAAHMVWSLEEGSNVAPIFCVQKGGEAWFERFENASYEGAAAEARELYDTISLSNGDCALLGYDGFLTSGEGKREESLFIHAFEKRNPEEVGNAYMLIVPYGSTTGNAGDLVIGQIKIFLPRNFPDSDKNIFLNNFKEGAYDHTKGFEFWNNHRDCNSELILISEL